MPERSDSIDEATTPRAAPSRDSEAIAREARRLCQRYIDEIVLRFGLCPWAEPALLGGRVSISVITEALAGEHRDERAAALVADALDGLDAHIELALVVLPRLDATRLEMDGLLRALRARDGKGVPQFALAAFHPDAALDLSEPERLIPYLRRSPDPLVQAVRTATLDRIDPARGSGTAFVDLRKLDLDGRRGLRPPEPLRLRVARTNQATLEQGAREDIERALADLAEDRRATWLRLLEVDVDLRH
jgi:hypothetical protein